MIFTFVSKRSVLRRLLVFLFFWGGGGLKFAVSCKKRFRRDRKYPANPISWSSWAQLARGFLRGRGATLNRLRRGETPQAHSNEQSKIKRSKAKLTNQKSAMQLKKVGTTDVTSVTIWNDPIICIALFLTNKAKLPLFKICERSGANFENKANKANTAKVQFQSSYAVYRKQPR